MTVEFAVTIFVNVDGIFCRRKQLVSKFKSYIVAKIAWKKSIEIGIHNIVAGDIMY